MPHIEFVCWLSHDGDDGRNRDGPTITLVEKTWAYCGAGGSDGHHWERIAPTSIVELHSIRIVNRVVLHSGRRRSEAMRATP